MKIKTGRIPNQTQRSRFIFLTLTLFITLFYTTLIFGATFHVDPTYTGSVQNGSITNPYNSWSKVTFTNNNSYLQKRGTTASITGSITITGRSNIIIGAYGTGNRPRINKTSGTGHVFDLTTISNCTIRDLEISSTSNATSGILIDGYGTAISSNNLIDNCVIHGTEWGIRIITAAAGNRILNSTIHNIGDDGIYIKDVLNIEIGYCNIYNINTKFFINPDQSYSAGDNIQLVSLNNMYFNIHHNILDHSSTGNKFCFIAAGETYSGVIEYNTMIGSQTSSCIYLGNTNNTVTVRYNTLKDATHAVYSYANNLQFHYNQVIRNNQGLSIMNNRNLTALNNVFYNNNGISIGSGTGTSVTSRNNIFHIAGSNSRVYNTNGSITSNNNNFNTQQNGFLSGHSTLSSWRSATGNDMNSFVANPLFVSPANDDFCVQPTSPCINAGANVNQPVDFFGTQVPQSNLPDIGFFELVNNQGGNQAPVINNQTFNVASNAPNGTIVGTVVATDPNQGQTLSFSITSGNTNGAFAINSGSGVITVANAAALTGNALNLVVRATDNGSPVMWSQATVTINISTSTNQAPVINNQSFGVIQGSSNGTVVGTVVATDPNAGQTLTFSITGGNTNNVFAIAAATGIITVANTSSMTTGVISITVRATDNGSPVMWSQATVSITVTAAGGNLPPVVVNQSFSSAPNPSNHTNIGIMIATDPNPGQTLRYNITGGNTNNAFYILSASGTIRVANSSAVNPGVFNLTVRVTDNGSPVMWSEATATITVGGGSNLPPVITNQSFSVTANSPGGTQVGTVVATDPNAGQSISFSITSGNTNSAFNISSSSGLITVGNSAAVNAGVFNLTVRATDNGSPVMWSAATVSINVSSGSNQPPVIANQTFSINENSPNGTLAGTVIANDPNAGQTLTYSITSGNSGGAFNLNASSGNLTVGNTTLLNFEVTPVFNLTVRVTDNGAGNLWSQATITVSLIDVNEAPVINPGIFSVAQFAPSGTFVGVVSGFDPDMGQSVTYQIISGNTSNAFHVNYNNGAINVINSSALDPNVNPVFFLNIRIRDNGSPSLSSTGIIRINVQSNKNGLVEEIFTPEGNSDPVFKLFPNPSSDGLFTLSAENFDKEAVIQIFDLAGKMVSEVNNFSDNRVSLNLEAMPKGIYMIRITAESYTKTIKAVKQ